MRFLNVLFLLVVISTLLTGCGTAPEAAAVADRKSTPATARQVTTMAAAEKSLDQVVVVTGTLAAEQEVVLGMKVSGRLADINVDLGTSIAKGDAIARLDTTDFELRVRQAEAALQQARVRLGLAPNDSDQRIELDKTAIVRQARAEMDAARARLDRALQLNEKGLLPKADLDTANSGYKVAEARYEDSQDEARNRQAILAQRVSELEIARQQLADTVLYAPIGGVVQQRNANAGQYLAAGTPIATVVQIHPLRLRTAVPEREARTIRSGQPVRVTVEGAPGVHQGRIARISPSFDEANRTLLVETEVSNSSGVLRPGAFSRAEVVVSSGHRALVVPSSSVVSFAGIERVFTIHEGKAAEKRVRTGRRNDAGIEILEGISAGDQLVLNPGNMTDGESVLVK